MMGGEAVGFHIAVVTAISFIQSTRCPHPAQLLRTDSHLQLCYLSGYFRRPDEDVRGSVIPVLYRLAIAEIRRTMVCAWGIRSSDVIMK